MEREVADLVEEQAAPVRRLEPPDPLSGGAGERAFGVAEQFGFEQGLAGRAEVDRDHRLVGTARQAMDLARDDFLARAVLAEDQHIGVGWGRPIDQLAHALHRRGFAEQWGLRRLRKLRRSPSLDARVDAAAAERRGAPHRRLQPLVAPRLGDEVARAGLDRLDRDRDAAMRGDDHHRCVGIDLHDLAERVEPLAAVGRAALEIEVEQDRVGAFALEQRQQVGG